MAQAQRQPTPQQLDFAQRVLAHDHKQAYGTGSAGTTVRAMQIYLASRGFAPGRFDGRWGDQTQAAFDKYVADRGLSSKRATPDTLATMSKEAGQPLPRQRPQQPLDNLAVDATGDAAAGAPPVSADATMAVPQTPDPDNLAPDASHAQEHEYDPNVLHAAMMNRNEPADMAEQPGYQPPIGLSPDPNQYGPDLNSLAVMPPAPPPSQVGPAPRTFDPQRFDPASQPVTSDTGVPDQLVEQMMATSRGSPMRSALLALHHDGNFQAPGNPSVDALKRALLMSILGPMAGR